MISHLKAKKYIFSIIAILGLGMMSTTVFSIMEDDSKNKHHQSKMMHHNNLDSKHKNKKHHTMKSKHGVGHKTVHSGGHHGGGHHGMVHKNAKKFPSTSYSETMKARPIEQPMMPEMLGDPIKGKHLAYTKSKGRCLACHIMGADGQQAGDVGPNLSNYKALARTDSYTFQQIWDARAHNSKTIMPPLGAHGVLNKHEVLHIVAYLQTLDQQVKAPQRPKLQERNFLVAGDDFTSADEYIESGALMFEKTGKNGKSCASCHSDKGKAGNLKSASASYPKYNSKLQKITNLDDQINLCRKGAMGSHVYKLGSKYINVLSSYVKYLSRNATINAATDGHAAKAIQRGKKGFYTKAGQFNFSCADCHVSSAGKWLRGQSLSSIKPEGKHSYTASTWPKHFIAKHDLGLISLQQRIRHCQSVTRTTPLKLGSQEYTDMELYLTTLANGKPMLAPTKSRLRGQD